MAAVQTDGLALAHAPKEMQNDKEVVMAAVQRNGMALQYSSKEMRNVKEVVMVAVQKDGRGLKDVPKEMQNDKEVVVAAMHNSGSNLEYATEEMKNDTEVFKAAVQQRGIALKYASKEMRNDKEMVMSAVQKDGEALNYASESRRVELVNDAQVLGVSVQEYVTAAAQPKIVQVFAAKGSDGYDKESMKISCVDMGGETVMTFPLNAEADSAQNLRGELAKTMGVSPAALQIINHRGERLRDFSTSSLIDFVAEGR